ncbi:hypothetical protein RRG08_067161 [Elysia crispata]|uniref:Uncharacterized protein n=1 Tax=Elysia crispata TaxID=231223 RepID=A0AAE0ZPA0_9GAST|nr:hypothetical protein RRG08_067161 [Elysia crispata]
MAYWNPLDTVIQPWLTGYCDPATPTGYCDPAMAYWILHGLLDAVIQPWLTGYCDQPWPTGYCDPAMAYWMTCDPAMILVL